jgi:hypothetical protein
MLFQLQRLYSVDDDDDDDEWWVGKDLEGSNWGLFEGSWNSPGKTETSVRIASNWNRSETW